MSPCQRCRSRLRARRHLLQGKSDRDGEGRIVGWKIIGGVFCYRCVSHGYLDEHLFKHTSVAQA